MSSVKQNRTASMGINCFQQTYYTELSHYVEQHPVQSNTISTALGNLHPFSHTAANWIKASQRWMNDRSNTASSGLKPIISRMEVRFLSTMPPSPRYSVITYQWDTGTDSVCFAARVRNATSGHASVVLRAVEVHVEPPIFVAFTRVSVATALEL